MTHKKQDVRKTQNREIKIEIREELRCILDEKISNENSIEAFQSVLITFTFIQAINLDESFMFLNQSKSYLLKLLGL